MFQDVDMISLEMNDRMKEVVNNKEKLNSDHVINLLQNTQQKRFFKILEFPTLTRFV